MIKFMMGYALRANPSYGLLWIRHQKAGARGNVPLRKWAGGFGLKMEG